MDRDRLCCGIHRKSRETEWTYGFLSIYTSLVGLQRKVLFSSYSQTCGLSVCRIGMGGNDGCLLLWQDLSGFRDEWRDSVKARGHVPRTQGS
jgi:hypothetical protein